MQDERCRDAPRKRMQEEFDRVGAFVVSKQDRRLAVYELECLRPGIILAPGAIEAADRRTVFSYRCTRCPE